VNLFRWIRSWFRKPEPPPAPRVIVARAAKDEAAGLFPSRLVRGNAIRSFQSRSVRGNAA
jgi:hypothetical protein